MKLNAGLTTSLLASDLGSTVAWDSKRINPWPQFCLCLTWSGCPSKMMTTKEIKNSNQVFVAADNAKNIYKINFNNYTELLNNNYTANFKKTNDSHMKDINKEAKIIAIKLNLDKRIEIFPNQHLFIMLKDHKSNFNNNSKCCPINPAKSKIGKISKFYLDKINENIRHKSQLNQWR